MVDTIHIEKILNGYVVKDSYLSIGEHHSLYFKDLPELIKHLGDLFKKPLKDQIEYEIKLKEVT